MTRKVALVHKTRKPMLQPPWNISQGSIDEVVEPKLAKVVPEQCGLAPVVRGRPIMIVLKICFRREMCSVGPPAPFA
jgi:hypothetical protein